MQAFRSREAGSRVKGGRLPGLAVGALAALALALPAGASAQGDLQQTEFLGPDLTPPPDFTLPCGQTCTHFGLEGPATPSQQPIPITAPADGTITGVQVRSQFQVPVELVQMDLVGQQVLFKSLHPLGTTSGNGIENFDGLGIPVDAGTVLGVSVEPSPEGGTIDGYQTPGQNGVGKVEPTPQQGEQRQPQVQGELQPAIRLAFVRKPPPGEVDIQVMKRRTSKRRPGVGGSAQFDVVVKNAGPDDAAGVVLFDGFESEELYLRSAKRAGGGGGGVCGPSPFGAQPAGLPGLPAGWGGDVMMVCDIGALAAGASVTYELDYEVAPLPYDVQSKTVENDAAGDATGSNETNYANNYGNAEIKVRRGGCRVRDVIQGTESEDRLVGKRKPEAIYGLGGKDKLKGKKGNDCLFGHEGKDKLVGNQGKDLLDGGKGNDKIKARDGERDEVDCGPGKRDKAEVDKKDKVKRNCEKVKIR